MLDDDPTTTSSSTDAPAGADAGAPTTEPPAAPPPKRRATRRRKSEPPTEAPTTPETVANGIGEAAVEATAPEPAGDDRSEPAAEPAKPSRRRRRAAPAPEAPAVADEPLAPPPMAVTFQPPQPVVEPDSSGEPAEAVEAGPAADGETEEGRRRRRRRGRRGRGRGRGDELGEEELAAEAGEDAATSEAEGEDADTGEPAAAEEPAEGGEPGAASARRRRRRRRRGAGGDAEEEQTGDDPERTVVHVREPRASDEEVSGVRGSTRLEAKRARRRESRESGRRRPNIISEAEFLARREAVERVMVVRQGGDRTQIAVLEDGVLVEHYVTREHATSYVGNVYLGRVQNVLPSMEAAFVDVGRGRNAVLYAGEVNYDASAFDGKPQRIEQALKSGQSVLVQVTKDPIGHKGARLTSQISLPGRYLVYVPDGQRTGISRKLPDTERARLKSILKKITPEDAGVIVRTAAEGATEEQLTRDVARLQAQWEALQKRAQTATAPALLYEEPDLVIRVIRDIFNEDFTSLVVQGDDEWFTVQSYVDHVAPDLRERLSRWTEDGDVFARHRVDEQLAKALDRKVWLPSGGYLIFDRTEAMVVIDVNTGKFTGKGGNLEETVTKNNLEAAEEIARQLRLRDLGGIIVIDFIDMVLESNRDLVLRRLLECLGRDRTRHQVAEITSLGLVQMTRKRVGQGLLEAFSQPCPECNGRGVKIAVDPFQPATESKLTPTLETAPEPMSESITEVVEEAPAVPKPARRRRTKEPASA